MYLNMAWWCIPPPPHDGKQREQSSPHVVNAGHVSSQADEQGHQYYADITLRIC